MRTPVIAAAIAPLALAQWWKGAPECAQSCLSSAFSSVTASLSSSGDEGTSGATTTAPPPSFWPAQQAYCDDPDAAGVAGSCVRGACAATPAVFTSYSSLSSSLCSRYASCTSAGRGTGTGDPGLVTVTHPAGAAVTWGAPPGWFGSAAPGSDGDGGPPPFAGPREVSKVFGPGPRFAGGRARRGGGAPHYGGYGRRPRGGWPDDSEDEDGDGDADGVRDGDGSDEDRDEDYSEHIFSRTSAHGISGTPGPGTGTGTPPSAGPPRTWGGGAVATVEACALFDGSPWYAGPGCGWNARGGFDGWVGWGAGWSWGPTSTQIVTMTMTVATAAAAAGTQTQIVQIQAAVATVALAVSGDYTTSTTVGVSRVTDDSSIGDGGGGGEQGSAAAGRVRFGARGYGVGGAATGMLGVWLALLVAVVAFL
ncbi:hypothetical protein DL764_010911 [Monosporascus ibericus]|uniref:Extracellular membrane protein CFEM domain-containing protein n=1 Tax=Monosporascus ibericus TaxID=155417 RepID=A0A4Q4SUA2_9PEZI|nr:hypothetical protein DL764_010911 [Monosporascus ibericus]